jgi:thioredoxin-like negative regulator of GroEL
MEISDFLSSSSSSSSPSLEQFSSSSSEKVIVYVYKDTCTWCDRFNPIWRDFTDRYAGPISTQKVEAREKQAHQYDITGYPTVLLVVNGRQTATFKDDRTVENLLKFAQASE